MLKRVRALALIVATTGFSFAAFAEQPAPLQVTADQLGAYWTPSETLFQQEPQASHTNRAVEVDVQFDIGRDGRVAGARALSHSPADASPDWATEVVSGMAFVATQENSDRQPVRSTINVRLQTQDDMPRIDGTTEATAQQSYQHLVSTLQPEKRLLLGMAMMQIGLEGMRSIADAQAAGRYENPGSILPIRERLHGMDFDGIMLEAAESAKQPGAPRMMIPPQGSE